MSRILDAHGSSRHKKVFALNEFNGNRYFEIEEYFYSKKQGEWKKKKGVTLNRDTYRLLHETLKAQHESIMDWIGAGYVPEGVSRYAELQEEAATETRTRSGALATSTYREPRDVRFFRVSHKGGSDIVELNSAHEAYDQFLALGETGQRLLLDILRCFARSRALLAETPAFDAATLFMHLEQDWSQFLRDSIRAAANDD